MSASYMSRPFNFFVCPYAHKLCNPSLSVRVLVRLLLENRHPP